MHYNALHKNINALVKQTYVLNSNRLKDAQRMLDALSPLQTIERYENVLRFYGLSVNNSMEAKLHENEKRIKATAAKLESLNPLSVLARGYAIAEKDGAVITGKNQLSEGDRFTLTFSDGQITAIAAGE